MLFNILQYKNSPHNKIIILSKMSAVLWVRTPDLDQKLIVSHYTRPISAVDNDIVQRTDVWPEALNTNQPPFTEVENNYGISSSRQSKDQTLPEFL